MLWLVPPVVENVFVIEAYAVPAAVDHLQTAFSSVANDIVVWFVPDDNVPVGWPLLLIGGVISGEATLKLIVALAVFGFPAVSWHLTYLVYDCPFVNPVKVVECDVAPVVEKVFGIDEYAWSVVDHLQFAFSFVVALNVVCVVPEGNT